MEKFKFQLGQLGRDKITGFTGIIYGVCRYVTGCDTYGLIPKVNDQGIVPDSKWFDEGRIEIIGEGVTIKNVASESGDGGPCDFHPNI